MSTYYLDIIVCSLLSAGFFSVSVLCKSIMHFSRTGPQIKDEIRQHYSSYTAYALARLFLWSLLACFIISLPGTFLLSLYFASQAITPEWLKITSGTIAGLSSISLICVRQFSHYLFYNPGLIVTSLNFDPIRLNPIIDRLTALRLHLGDAFVLISFTSANIYLFSLLVSQQNLSLAINLGFIPLIGLATTGWIILKKPATLNHKTTPTHKKPSQQGPNILMIGSDTLRSDHISAHGYHRDTTPFIDSLAKKGTYFKNCFVPIARTAPSLTSLFTGCWPNTHKVKTNYCSQQQAAAMKTPGLASLFAKKGYQTSVISDWAGSDFGKFDFGFQRQDLPKDQWNLKYLIRQGPKDIRLLLSLFCHNFLGKKFLPELYYLAGIPLTCQLGKKTRQEIDFLASQNQPFLLNVFMGTTHPPFASNYPFYKKYADAEYAGKSRFCMSRLTTPEEIIESQQEPREAFDLDQVIALYDGTIRQFDSEVERIIDHLDKSGLRDNTIVVIYSDHGIDFFESDTWGQGNSIASDASAKTPFIIQAPNTNKAKTVSEKIRNIDIAPTLLELAGLNIPNSIEGISLAPALQGQETPGNLPVIFETGLWLAPPPMQRKNHLSYPDIFHLIEIPDKKAGTLALKTEYSAAIENARDWFIWSNNWILKCYSLTSGPHYELFDSNNDANCTSDIAALHPDIIQKLSELKSNVYREFKP